MIDRDRSTRIKASIREVLHDLHNHADREEPASVTPFVLRTIVCMEGRRPYDPILSTMLGQLLERRGNAARIVPSSAGSRDAMATSDLNGVDVIALTYLTLSGAPSHLPYLVRRLRQRVPGAKIIVGLLPDGISLPADFVQKVAADQCCASLVAMRDAILNDISCQNPVPA